MVRSVLHRSFIGLLLQRTSHLLPSLLRAFREIKELCSLLAAGFFFKGHLRPSLDECLVIANAKERYGSAPMSRPILLQAKQCLLIIPAEISREKQTASSLGQIKERLLYYNISLANIDHNLLSQAQEKYENFDNFIHQQCILKTGY